MFFRRKGKSSTYGNRDRHAWYQEEVFYLTDGKSEYEDGKIYDPPSGKTYTCKAWLENDKLHLRGYLGFSLLGKTVVWHRYTGN